LVVENPVFQYGQGLLMLLSKPEELGIRAYLKGHATEMVI
jgi:hypothetical protein